jgi:hypothetical protein
MKALAARVSGPSSRSGRAIGTVFGVMAYGFSAASGICLSGWLSCGGPHLPPGTPLYAWFSAFGFPAAVACLTLGTIWFYARRAWLAGRAGVAWGYCGLGIAVLVVVIGLTWLFGGMPWRSNPEQITSRDVGGRLGN